MRDTRSYEIKRILQKEYPTAKFRVFIHKYSMGESINIRTDLIKREQVNLDTGGYTMSWTPESKINHDRIKYFLREYESVDRDQWGEILSGGNTYLFVDELK